MAVNQVIYGGKTLIDLTSDTVTENNLLKGYTAHDKTGELIVGTLEATGGGLTLPDGYAMEMGLYTPTSDISSAITIDLQNTYRWNDSGKKSACFLSMFAVTVQSGTQAAGAGFNARFGTGNRTHSMVTQTSSTSTSSTVFINPKTTTTFNQITLTGTGSYPMKKDVTYMWMVIGELAA